MIMHVYLICTDKETKFTNFTKFKMNAWKIFRLSSSEEHMKDHMQILITLEEETLDR